MGEKKIGIIGLGKMGYRIAQHLIEKNYVPVAMDLNLEVVKKIKKKKKVIAVNYVKELVNNIPRPRVILFSIPAEGVDKLIKRLIPYLSKGDIIIDSGNSFYKDSIRRAAYLKDKGIYLIDVGISGGIKAARYGACLMIGGNKKAFEKKKDVFEALSKDGSYKYFGKSGSGHLVKGYHNLVEYGYLQSLAEGLTCIKKVSEKEKMSINLKDVCGIWNKGSIVESRITRDAECAFKNNPKLHSIKGSVFGQTQKEMEKLVKIAKEQGIEVPCCKAALNARIKSKNNNIAGKIINAIRNVFGGHEEWKKQ